jgi:hypothetical protein
VKQWGTSGKSGPSIPVSSSRSYLPYCESNWLDQYFYSFSFCPEQLSFKNEHSSNITETKKQLKNKKSFLKSPALHPTHSQSFNEYYTTKLNHRSGNTLHRTQLILKVKNVLKILHVSSLIQIWIVLNCELVDLGAMASMSESLPVVNSHTIWSLWDKYYAYMFQSTIDSEKG